MDEIESDPLTLVLFRERLYFPLLLDYAMQEGFSELLLFLIESDKLRTDEDLEAPTPSADIMRRIYNTYFARENCIVRECVVAAGIDLSRLKAAVDIGIPMQTLFASLCECVWRDVLLRMRELPKSSMWPQVRKAILDEEHGRVELLSVLSDTSFRVYYERYIRTDPGVLACMHCWLNVRDMLQQVSPAVQLERMKRESLQPSFGDEPRSPGRSSGAAIARRYSAIAASGARNALLTFSGSSTAQVNRSVQLGQDLEDPLEALKVLLNGTRKLQRLFFPVLDSSINSRIHLESNSSSMPSGGFYEEGGTPCAGISDNVRVELATTLDMAKDVRTYDIEAVDPAFAVACAGSIVRLLQVIEREAFQHLQLIFPAFLESVEYTNLVASTKALASESVLQYTMRCLFLEDKVRRRKVIPWTDPEARGRTYVFYEERLHDFQHQSSGIGEDDVSSDINRGEVRIASSRRTQSTMITCAARLPWGSCDTRDRFESHYDFTNMQFFGMWVGEVNDGHAGTDQDDNYKQLILGSLDPAAIGQAAGLEEDESPQAGAAVIVKAITEALHGQTKLQTYLAHADVSSPLTVTCVVDPQYRKCTSLLRLQAIKRVMNKDDRENSPEWIFKASNISDGDDAEPIRLTICLDFNKTNSQVCVGLALTCSSDKYQDVSSECTDLSINGITPLLSLERSVAFEAATCDENSDFLRVKRWDEEDSGEQKEGTGSGIETLMDLYVQYAVVKSDRDRNMGSSVMQHDVSSVLRRHLGACDFPLVRSICRLPTRTLLQILLLLLTGRSVILLGHSPSMVSELMSALPRFVWPFSLSQTHKQTQLHSSVEFAFWIKNQTNKSKSTRTPDDNWRNSTNNLGWRNDLCRAWIIGCSQEVYHSMSAELKMELKKAVTDNNSSVPGRWNTGVFIFDIDLGEIHHPTRHDSQQQDDFEDPNSNGERFRGGSMQAASKLVSPFSFRRLNSRSFHFLDRALRRQTEPARLAAKRPSSIDLRGSNNAIEMAFAQYFTNLCLRFLPQNIYHYPQQTVVSCDVRTILAQVNAQAREHAEQTEGVYLATNADSYLPELCDLEVEFVSEFMGLGAPAFKELMVRQGVALSKLFL